MSHDFNAPSLGALGGRAVWIRLAGRRADAGEAIPGVLEVRDVAGDQDGPAVVVVVDREIAAAHGLPHTIALDTKTITSLLEAESDTEPVITLSAE